MSTEKSQRTIVIDLDNTLANYDGGWEANKNFPGPPRNDVVKGLRALYTQGYIIGIFTTRPNAIVKQWLAEYELDHLIEFVNCNPYQPEGASPFKPIAFCYIDDRAIRYNGDNMQEIVDGILNGDFEPWNKK